MRSRVYRPVSPQNPIGAKYLADSPVTRLFEGVRYRLSLVVPKKGDATRHADKLRGHGIKVRVVKLSDGYGLYTR